MSPICSPDLFRPEDGWLPLHEMLPPDMMVSGGDAL